MTTIGAATNKMFRTTDLGANWTEETLPAQGSQNKINHVQFYSQTIGYAGCNGGYVMRYGNPSSIGLISSEVPADFVLEQNYPNPFNPSTKINFAIPRSENVRMVLYDMNGREVAVLVNEFKEAGSYSLSYFPASELSSGLYFYTLKAGDFVATKKLMLVK
jgi:hypothetical protein